MLPANAQSAARLSGCKIYLAQICIKVEYFMSGLEEKGGGEKQSGDFCGGLVLHQNKPSGSHCTTSF